MKRVTWAAVGLGAAVLAGSVVAGVAMGASPPGDRPRERPSSTDSSMPRDSSVPAEGDGTDHTAPPGSGGSVSGTIYRDVNSNGSRDANEPGVPDITVGKAGTPYATVTGVDGRYTLRLPAGPHRLSVLTGWLRSQCPGDLVCPAGTGAQQDYAAENQFYRSTLDLHDGQVVTGLDAGFLPDHGDPASSPNSANEGNDGGDGAAAVADLAVRHSIGGDRFGSCDDPVETRVCRIGDTFTTNVQLYNQGTTAADRVSFIVSEPAGSQLLSPPRPNRATPGYTVRPTGRTGTLREGSTWAEYVMNRPLPPAAAAFFTLRWEVVDGPVSPLPYRTGVNRDKKSYLKVSSAALEAPDRDSSYGTDPVADRNAGHNVNWPQARDEDAMDTIEWNVR